MLPQIHKPNNPGRPVIYSINSHTEKLSAYVNEFLTPLGQAPPSHIRDTTDFIVLLKNLGRVPENSILATLDVSRICSSTHALEQRILEYSNFSVSCGYKRDRVLSEMCKVLSLTQDTSLRARGRHTTNHIPLVTTYNPLSSYIAEVANRKWLFLQLKERLAHIFRERSIIAYRRSKSLCDILVSTKLTGRTLEEHTTTMGSCGPCNKCSWCVLINKTSTFTGMG